MCMCVLCCVSALLKVVSLPHTRGLRRARTLRRNVSRQFGRDLKEAHIVHLEWKSSGAGEILVPKIRDRGEK